MTRIGTTSKNNSKVDNDVLSMSESTNKSQKSRKARGPDQQIAKRPQRRSWREIKPPAKTVFFPILFCPPIPLVMPIDESGRFWVWGPFQSQTISRMSRATYARACNSSNSAPRPYPSSRSLMTRVAADGNAWYQDTGPELHLSDFIFLTRMQTACRLSERTTRIPSRDLVLERLLSEGTWYWNACFPKGPGIGTLAFRRDLRSL